MDQGPGHQKDLETQFHEAMISIYRRARDECQYPANRFLQMVSVQGGLQTARSLLHAPGFSDGLTELWRHGRLDISMEALVLKERWAALFSEGERTVARRRLLDLGYDPTATA